MAQTLFCIIGCGWLLLAHHHLASLGSGPDNIHARSEAYDYTTGRIRSYTTLEVINYGIICARDYQTFRSHIDSRAFATGNIVDSREIWRQIGRLRLTAAIYGSDEVTSFDDARLGNIEGRCRCFHHFCVDAADSVFVDIVAQQRVGHSLGDTDIIDPYRTGKRNLGNEMYGHAFGFGRDAGYADGYKVSELINCPYERLDFRVFTLFVKAAEGLAAS